TGEPYTVPLTAKAKAALAQARKGRDVHPEAFVLITEQGVPFQPSRVNLLFRKAKKLAKITRRFRVHDLRHDLGHRLKASGKVTDSTIRAMLGWSEQSGMVFHYGGDIDTKRMRSEILAALEG